MFAAKLAEQVVPVQTTLRSSATPVHGRTWTEEVVEKSLPPVTTLPNLLQTSRKFAPPCASKWGRRLHGEKEFKVQSASEDKQEKTLSSPRTPQPQQQQQQAAELPSPRAAAPAETPEETTTSWCAEVCRCWQRSWDVFATSLVVNVVFMLASMLIEPALRSWVVCSSEAEAVFSGSATCGDRTFVIQAAVEMGGSFHAVQGLVGLAAIPMCGAFSDRHGRLPVLYLSFASVFIWLLLCLFANSSTALLSAGFAIKGLTSFASTFSAILGDRGGNRSVAFTMNLFAAQLGAGIGWVVALFVLRAELEDYSLVWIVCLATFAFAFCLSLRIRESLPAPAAQEPPCKDIEAVAPSAALPPVEEQPVGSCEAYRALLLDPFFLRYCASKILLTFGISVSFILRSFAMAAYAWPQGRFEALLGFVGISVVVSTLLGPMLVRRFSVQAVLVASYLTIAFAVSLLCLAPLGPAFLLGPLLLLGLTACAVAASQSLVAERFARHQGKAQSVEVVVMQLSVTLAHFLWSRLYDAGAAGFNQTVPFLVASVACWLGVGLLLLAFAQPVQHAQHTQDLKEEVVSTSQPGF